MILRRWQSIDRKLPLMASGLVLLTAAALGWTAYLRLEGALRQAAESRLFGTAQAIAQMVQRPTARTLDSVSLRANEALRQFMAGRLSRDSALRHLSRPVNPGDTVRYYSALLDTTGRAVLAYQRPPAREPSWPRQAAARGEVRGDTLVYGPFENVGGVPVITTMRALRASTSSGAPLLGYVVDGRTLTSARGARAFRGLLGDDVQLLIGQPGAGVWTDLGDVAPPPPIQPVHDSTLQYAQGVAATARVPGTRWIVWLSQPAHSVLAPARRLWWSMIPMGIVIALVSAALMWRMAHRITHPIVALTTAVEGIAKDTAMARSAESPSEVRDADEVTRLRSAFDRMSARVAEREALELQLRHAQKMEAVGRLAGGIAHDFNNLLTAIRSYADLMIDDMPPWDSKRGDVEEIRKAAHRASALTAQLLAFSRKQMLQPRVLDTGVVLQDVEAMLRRLLIEDIRLTVETPPGVWPVKADRGQLEQVIVNLAVNARDAMPHGGSLRIAARNAVVSGPIETKHGPIPPGEYVSVSVTDTGLGMDAVTQSRAFEPFFTTKGVGQGTGLGLATVHGIVAQSGGYVTLQSAPQSGTTFTVYLPRAYDEVARDNAPSVTGTRGNNETILLVEDEQSVRSLARRVLVRAGFRVLESTTPKDALRLAREHFGEIKLVLSDVVMPEMSGPALVQRIAEVCPSAKVLFISGYTDDEVIGRGLASDGMLLLQKPFSAQQLVERVRSALDVA